MAKKNKKNEAHPFQSRSPWEERLVETPRDDIAVPGKQYRRSRIWRGYFIAAAILTPLLSVTSFFMGSEILLSRSVTPESTTLTSAQEDGRALALETVRTWLLSEPAPLPGGHVVGWDGLDPQPRIQSQANANQKSIPVDVHRVTVAAKGVLYHANVPIARYAGGVSAVGEPSLLPYLVDKSGTGNAWNGSIAPSNTDHDAIQAAVQTWATAFYSGDPSLVRQAVGDSEGRYYPVMPLASVKAQVSNMTLLEEASKDGEEGNLVARVVLSVAWPQKDIKNSEPPSFRVEYDVLMEGANTPSPRVLAWGAAGEGPSLKPYGNGVKLPNASKNTPANPNDGEVREGETEETSEATTTPEATLPQGEGQ